MFNKPSSVFGAGTPIGIIPWKPATGHRGLNRQDGHPLQKPSENPKGNKNAGGSINPTKNADFIYGVVWFYMALYGFIWFHMVLYGFIWFYMVLYGFIWFSGWLPCLSFYTYRFIYVLEASWGMIWYWGILPTKWEVINRNKQDGPPPVISWFITPSKCSYYKYHTLLLL